MPHLSTRHRQTVFPSSLSPPVTHHLSTQLLCICSLVILYFPCPQFSILSSCSCFSIFPSWSMLPPAAPAVSSACFLTTVNLLDQRVKLFLNWPAWRSCICEHMLPIHRTRHFEYHIFSIWQPHLPAVIWSYQTTMQPLDERIQEEHVYVFILPILLVTCTDTQSQWCKEARVRTYFHYFNTTNAYICAIQPDIH